VLRASHRFSKVFLNLGCLRSRVLYRVPELIRCYAKGLGPVAHFVWVVYVNTIPIGTSPIASVVAHHCSSKSCDPMRVLKIGDVCMSKVPITGRRALSCANRRHIGNATPTHGVLFLAQEFYACFDRRLNRKANIPNLLAGFDRVHNASHFGN
jgi:hypothetical protein